MILYIIIEKNKLRLSDTFENAIEKRLIKINDLYCYFSIPRWSYNGEIVNSEKYLYFNIRKDSIVVSHDEFNDRLLRDKYIRNSNLVSENGDADVKYIYDNYKK